MAKALGIHDLQSLSMRMHDIHSEAHHLMGEYGVGEDRKEDMKRYLQDMNEGRPVDPELEKRLDTSLNKLRSKVQETGMSSAQMVVAAYEFALGRLDDKKLSRDVRHRYTKWLDSVDADVAHLQEMAPGVWEVAIPGTDKVKVITDNYSPNYIVRAAQIKNEIFSEFYSIVKDDHLDFSFGVRQRGQLREAARYGIGGMGLGGLCSLFSGFGTGPAAVMLLIGASFGYVGTWSHIDEQVQLANEALRDAAQSADSNFRRVAYPTSDKPERVDAAMLVMQAEDYLFGAATLPERAHEGKGKRQGLNERRRRLVDDEGELQDGALDAEVPEHLRVLVEEMLAKPQNSL